MPTVSPSGEKNPTKNLIMTGLVMIFAGLVIGYQFLLPKMKDSKTAYDTAAAQLKGLKQDITRLRTAGERLEAAKAKLAENGVDLNILDAVAPQYEDIPSLYIQSEDLVRRNTNLTQPSYQINPPVMSASGDYRIPVNFTAIGKYKELKDFLKILENNVRPVSITSLTLSPASINSNGKREELTGQFSLACTGFFRARALSPAYESVTQGTN